MRKLFFASPLIALLCLVSSFPLSAQRLGEARALAARMLNDIESDLHRNYYDPNFHGLDIEARFDTAEEHIERAKSLNQALGAIAWALDGLNDSHTFFIPPPRPYKHSYGWKMQMMGERCYVTAVRPGTDAEKQGLKPGDRVLSWNGWEPTRESVWKLGYFFNILNPQLVSHLRVEGVDGSRRDLQIKARFREETRVDSLMRGDLWKWIWEAQRAGEAMRDRSVEFGTDLMIWKMPIFDGNEAAVDNMMDRARNYKSLILDLRGNPGGGEHILLRLVGHFIDRKFNIFELKRRKGMEPAEVEPHGDRPFAGQLLVLVDSQSGSAAELFARIVQLEKLGLVIGDRTAGKVMRSRFYDYKMGFERLIFFAALITDSDIVMADGQSLENVGVVPDQRMLPTGEDLAENRDPVLSYAAGLAGVELSPEKAGQLFPVEWVED